MDLNNVIGNISCCGEPFPGNGEKLIAEYYDMAFQCLDPLLTQAISKELYGITDVQQVYNKINDFHFLLGLLMIIVDDIRLSARGNPCGIPDYATILERYNLQCIMNHFKCFGCRINLISRIFSLFNVSVNIDDLIGDNDGIGAMYIEGGGADCPAGNIFRVF
jgi:hypothetical protein